MTEWVALDDLGDVRADLVPEHSWKPSSLIVRAANPPAAPTIGGLLYPAKRTLLSGETESLKTWLALILAKAELDLGLSVCWIDLDAMGPGELLARLQTLGVDDDIIDQRFLYYEPSERLIGDILAEVCGEVRERGIRLFVVDSFNPMLGLHGLDPSSTPDIETFWREVATPITEAGAAPTLLDHVVKQSDNRGKYAYGSERKASGAIVHVGFRLLEPFTRGGTGRTLLATHKDRPGYLPRPVIGRLVLDSDGAAVTYRLEADHSRDSDKFRPTFLMERVSEFLAAQDEPVSRKRVEDGVAGKAGAVRTAIDVLVDEGFSQESEGPRGARLVTFIRAFREDEDIFEAEETTSSRPRPDLVPNLVSTREIDLVPRPPYRGRGRGQSGETGTTSSRPRPDDLPAGASEWGRVQSHLIENGRCVRHPDNPQPWCLECEAEEI